jgi:8-oxo-dGTP diphosphatase
MFELFEVYPLSDITKFKIEYVSIFSQYQNKWVICHLKNTDKWDCPGGKIEFNERSLQAAMRELFEETGTVEADFLPLFIYCINSDKGLTYGIQYFSEIVELEDLPDYEMDKIEFHHQIPFEKLKTPEVHKKLFTYVHQIINSGII